MSESMSELKIGQVAKAAGVAIDTVRYYERRGLLPTPDRRPSGYRTYGPQTVDRLKLVKQLQELGLSLDDISGMLDAVSDADADCSHERPRIETALQRTEAKLAALNVVRRKLKRALARCESGDCDLVEQVRRVATRRRTVS